MANGETGPQTDTARTPSLLSSSAASSASPAALPPASRFQRWLYDSVWRRHGRPRVTLVLWDGTTIGATDNSVGRILFRSPKIWWPMLTNPPLSFGEAYMAGDIDIEGDLIATLTEVNLGVSRSTAIVPDSGLRRWWPASPHSRRHSRKNVAHHYDLGNDFYQLWLDEQLVYTCAYYARPEMTLSEAQTAKLDYVCRKLRLRPGETVAEAGCGWGALALHMARNYGVRVRAWNLSREQIAYARERAEREGLADRVEFVREDYREMTGSYDAFVSVGMLEHVGVERYRELGRVIDRVLTPNGRGLIHSIGRNWARPLDPWTTKYIFPGAHPGSLKQMMDISETSGLSVLDVENLRLHYARTCSDWLHRFTAVEQQVRAQFDERFVRMWRLYLASSAASFLSGDLQLVQIVFSRATNNSLPWTRDDWYQPATTGSNGHAPAEDPHANGHHLSAGRWTVAEPRSAGIPSLQTSK